MAPKRKAVTVESQPTDLKKLRTRAATAAAAAAAVEEAKTRRSGRATRSTPVQDGYDRRVDDQTILVKRLQLREERVVREQERMLADTLKNPKGAVLALVDHKGHSDKYAIRVKEFPFIGHIQSQGSTNKTGLEVLTLCTCTKTRCDATSCVGSGSDCKCTLRKRVHEYADAACPANEDRLAMIKQLEEESDSTQKLKDTSICCNFPYAMHVWYTYMLPAPDEVVLHSHPVPAPAKLSID